MIAELNVKQILLDKCTQYIHQRIDSIQKKLDEIAEAQNSETKSSAGDKHETGRTMMQLETQKMTVQLYAALEVKQTLDQILIDNKSTMVGLGSLVKCNTGNYYIAISSGKILIEDVNYYAISLQSNLNLY